MKFIAFQVTNARPSIILSRVFSGKVEIKYPSTLLCPTEALASQVTSFRMRDILTNLRWLCITAPAWQLFLLRNACFPFGMRWLFKDGSVTARQFAHAKGLGPWGFGFRVGKLRVFPLLRLREQYVTERSRFTSYVLLPQTPKPHTLVIKSISSSAQLSLRSGSASSA